MESSALTSPWPHLSSQDKEVMLLRGPAYLDPICLLLEHILGPWVLLPRSPVLTSKTCTSLSPQPVFLGVDHRHKLSSGDSCLMGCGLRLDRRAEMSIYCAHDVLRCVGHNLGWELREGRLEDGVQNNPFACIHVFM